jgi:6-pyruvoyltetrahydropterin/6-carboxytetrahydropterin synthase
MKRLKEIIKETGILTGTNDSCHFYILPQETQKAILNSIELFDKTVEITNSPPKTMIYKLTDELFSNAEKVTIFGFGLRQQSENSEQQILFRGEIINKKMKYSSQKVYDGFSTVFRQWRADGTHCKFLHGYAVSFKVYFEGDLDEKNWVFDFGGMKRAKTKIDGMNPKEWMDYMFDHTTIIAEDDPYLETFKQMDKDGIIQLRIIPASGAERFAEYIYNKLNNFVLQETGGRVTVTKVIVRENGKNSASFSR